MSRLHSKVSLRRGAVLTALLALLCNLAAPAAMTFGARNPSASGERGAQARHNSAPAAALGTHPAPQTQTSNIRQVPLPTNDIVFDKQSQKIFASVPSRAGVGGNSVTSLDPRSGLADDPIFVGSEPTILALSDDGQSLYVALDGSASVRRVDVPSRTAGLKFTLGSSNLDGPYRASDLAAVPDSPGSVAVVKGHNTGGYTRAHVVYDNGVQRSKVFFSHNGAAAIEFAGSASVLYAIDKGDLSFPAFRKLTLDSEGVSQAATTQNLINGATDIKFDAGLFYASNGKVIDPEKAAVVGDFGSQGTGALVAPDSGSRRVFFLSGNSSWGTTPRTLTLRAFDQVTLQPAGTLEVPGVTGTPTSLIRWGANGLAFRTSNNQLFLIQTSLVPSDEPIPEPTPAPTPAPTPTPVAASVARLEMTTGDLVFDPRRQLIYASRPSTPAGEGNSVTALDPASGSVGPSIFVGSEPAKLALSDNGQYLYVALDGAGGVRRVDLTTGTAGLQFSLGGGGTMTVKDMEVLPGNPAAVAVSRQVDGSRAPRFEGVAVYDDGVKRPKDTKSFSGGNFIEFSDSASGLYGIDVETASGFYRMAVDSEGVRNLSNQQGLLNGDIKYSAGLVYSQSGHVINPVTLELEGKFDASGAMLPDPAVRRVYYVSATAGIRAFDMDTFVPVGVVPIPGMKGSPSSLVRWGANGLAFRTSGGEVYLVRSDLVPSPMSVAGPAPAPAPTPRPSPTPVPVTVRRLELPTNDIIYDPLGGKIYGSLPGNAAQSPHSLVPVDPSTGALGPAVFIGNDPGQLAISDNSQYIYVAQNAPNSPGVRRFDVASQTAGLQFALGSDSFHGKYFVSDMTVLPGNPSALAVARKNITSSDGDEGVAVYDDGVPRPAVSAPRLSTSNSMIEPSESPSTLYSLNANGGSLDRLAVDASGVSSPPEGRGVGSLSAHDMKFAGGRLYGSNRRVVDPEVRSLVGTYWRFGADVHFGLALPDASAGRVYLIISDIVGSEGNEVLSSIKLRAYDMWTFLPVGESNLGTVRGRAAGLIRWGARGFALRSTGGHLLIAETDLASPPPVDSVQFSSATYTRPEGGKVVITVTRGGDAAGAAEVTYATTDLSAHDTRDYSAAVGTLRFGPNEKSKSFDVLLNDDTLAEGDESFNVALGGPVNATLGPLAVVTVRITDDDAVSGPSPVKAGSLNPQFFVRQHYHDFLNREPDEAGLAFWTNEIEGCGTDLQCREVKRINVSAAFFLSIEFQETGYLAYRAHKAAFGDATSPGVEGTVPVIRLRELLADAGRIGQAVRVGIGDWQQQLEANKNAYALEFVRRQRFRDAYPATLTADDFVSRLDQNAGGVLSASEKGQLIASLGSTPADEQKRAAVLRAVAESSVLRQREFNRAFVLMQYHGYLRRNPDDAPDRDFRGWKFWLDKLNQFDGNFINAEMVKAFLDSIEYGDRFGK